MVAATNLELEPTEKLLKKATETLAAERDHYKMLTQELGQELRIAQPKAVPWTYAKEDGSWIIRQRGVEIGMAYSEGSAKSLVAQHNASIGADAEQFMREGEPWTGKKLRELWLQFEGAGSLDLGWNEPKAWDDFANVINSSIGADRKEA